MEVFEHLPEAKRVQILNAAITCFGRNGYHKASVGDIAAAAGVSKASIFQYFGTKEALYRYVFRYASALILRETPVGNEDFFQCLKMASDAKMRVMEKHPGMFDYLSSLVLEDEAGILRALRESTGAQVGEATARLFSRVNWDKLKPGVSREKAFQLVSWINNGYLREAVGKKDAETMRRELFEYLELARKMLYREEYW